MATHFVRKSTALQNAATSSARPLTLNYPTSWGLHPVDSTALGRYRYLEIFETFGDGGSNCLSNFAVELRSRKRRGLGMLVFALFADFGYSGVVQRFDEVESIEV